ncbi:NADP-dependent oxidoreductase domain-containing protein 1 isoform X2 [Octopus bimaculoides]|uniref:Pyrroline-5-carboxylate reductase catalytic N-terminal domain-containing protein n=2 Tax=Octopus bimaculoides TaxID=37653 RepID=A0A0L8I6L8_OCTBM|nr:NADP-dependent oxidoreductase domain-containing protein 1 isoform X2 [Octopus bimaculoides]|eukprot:XP_014790444.1 PREDICTED: NADP-dependent oxidoreductase domain-containing protein 1-like isoform X2 [Octopus bimaculoides]
MEDRALIPLPHDLTSGLDSLSLEKAYGEKRSKYINKLCYSCQIINITICVYAIYFINAMDAIKKAVISKELCKDASFKIPNKKIPGVRIGMIGCGVIGQQIVRCLLYQNNIKPHNLLISTRTPEQLDEFTIEGISCTDDNFEVCRFAEVLLLAIPPSQLTLLSKEIRDHLSRKCIVYSILAGQDLQKLATMLRTDNVYNLDVYISEETTASIKWEQMKIPDILSDEDLLKMFLPFRGSDSIIEDVNRLPAIITCAAINLSCAISAQKPEEMLSLVQLVIFSALPLDEDERFWIEDFGRNLSSSYIVSIFKTQNNVATLLRKVKKSSNLQMGFVKAFMQYCYVPTCKKGAEWHDIKRSLTIE